MPTKFRTLALFIASACIAAFAIRIEDARNFAPNPEENLKSLPYISWTEIAPAHMGKSGVRLFDKESAFRGVNLFNSRHNHIAYLVDMEGRILHRWQGEKGRWHRIHADENGNLYAIERDKRILKLDWDSNLTWEYPDVAHHDFDIDENGDIYLITQEKRQITVEGRPGIILDDYIVRLSPEGEIVRKISLFDLFSGMVRPERFTEILELFAEGREDSKHLHKEAKVRDVLHTNSIQVIDRTVKGFAKKGDMLLSLRELNTIAVIDEAGQEIVWQWGQDHLLGQHHASLLENNHVLVFDNQREKKRSRILEIDPVSNQIVWQYYPDGAAKFYTKGMGGVQRLANGNTLITESTLGRAFEITPAGQLVWDFWNPEIKFSAEGRKRGVLYRLERLDPGRTAQLPLNPGIRDRLKAEGYFGKEHIALMN